MAAGADNSSPRWSRILSAMGDWGMTAMIFMEPPHRSQRSMSIAKTRRSNSAHERRGDRRDLPSPVSSTVGFSVAGLVGAATSEGDIAARGTMALRKECAGANTPWYGYALLSSPFRR